MGLASPDQDDELPVLDDVLVLRGGRGAMIHPPASEVHRAASRGIPDTVVAARLAREQGRPAEELLDWVRSTRRALLDRGQLGSERARANVESAGPARQFARWQLPLHLDRLLAESAAGAEASGAAAGLAAHGVDALAAWVLHRRDEPIPPALRRGAWETGLHDLISRQLIQALRDAYVGPMWLLKGLEIGCRYPTAGLRRQGDLDILVREPERLAGALVQAGWYHVGSTGAYRSGHQLAPLRSPNWPVDIDLHRDISWPSWTRPPPADELLERSGPSVAGIDGVLALAAEDQALHVAAHSYGHRPFWQLRDLIDVAVLRSASSIPVVVERAEEWGLRRLWRLTTRTVDHHLLDDGPAPLAFRAIGGHVRRLQDSSLARVFADKAVGRFAVATPRDAVMSLTADAVGQIDLGRPATAAVELLARLSQPSRNQIGSAELAFEPPPAAESMPLADRDRVRSLRP